MFSLASKMKTAKTLGTQEQDALCGMVFTEKKISLLVKNSSLSRRLRLYAKITRMYSQNLKAK